MHENVENQPIVFSLDLQIQYRFVSYEPLDSSYSTNGDIPEDSDVSKSQLRDNYDEEDEMVYEESDLEDDDDGYFDDDDDDDHDDCDNYIIDDRFESLNMDSTKGDGLIQLDEDKSKYQRSLCGSTNGNAKIRCQYLCFVLTPVENTTQWK
ncbi:hypothetical protein V6N13_051174 [Hibiscus sabdariffa]